MNVVMNYSHSSNMLQLAIFPERYDDCQDIQHVQGKMSSRDIKNITMLIRDFSYSLEEVYEGWDDTNPNDDWKQEVFKLSKMDVRTSHGYVFLEHRHRVIRLYMMGGCLTMSLKTLEDVLKQLEKIKNEIEITEEEFYGRIGSK